jgi:septal ring factor EnvC (AmiA/AmiB activator)
MKIKSVLYLTVLAAVCLFSNGCNEGMSPDQIRQARLVGNENLQLKKQIQAGDSQIADLNKQLEQARQEIARAQKQMKDNDTRIAALSKELEQTKQESRQEITRVNEASVEIQKSLNAALSDSRQRLENYEKAAIAAPNPCPDVEKQYATLYEDMMKLLSECQGKLEKYEPAEKKP